MPKMDAKQQTVLHLGAALILVLVLLSVSAQKTECLSTAANAAAAEGCNSTRIADCLPDDEESLMESETNRRILQAGKGGKTITYDSLNKKKPFCNRDVYNNCIGEASKNFNGRKCDYQSHCGGRGN